MTWILDHLGSILTALGFLVTSIYGLIIKHQVQEVHLSLNSRLDKLLAAVAVAARLEGVEAEKLRAKNEIGKGSAN